MFGDSISSRVSKVIKERTKLAQAKHDEEVKACHARHEAAVQALEMVRDGAIEDSATKAVESVIGKIN